MLEALADSGDRVDAWAVTNISQAGNTVVPAILALEAKGFTVEVSESLVVARSDLGTFTADDPVAVLGLVALVETRGAEWRASDTEIDLALARFHL